MRPARGRAVAAHHRAHERRAEQQVVDEGEVGIGAQFAVVDAAVEGLPHRLLAWSDVIAEVALRQFGVAHQIGTRPAVMRRDSGLSIILSCWR